jgi:hypothetical protein
MNARSRDAAIEQWLKDLAGGLASLPTEDVGEIVAEAREHLYELLDKGESPGEALAGFGSANSYARCFLDERILEKARASRRTIPLLHVVVRLAGRSSVAIIGLAAAIVVGFVGVWSLICIGIEVFRPELVGLWLDLPLSAARRYEHTQPEFIPLNIGHDHIVFGFQNPPPHFPEYLGQWVYLLLAVIVLLSYFAVRRILRATVSRIRLPLRTS